MLISIIHNWVSSIDFNDANVLVAQEEHCTGPMAASAFHLSCDPEDEHGRCRGRVSDNLNDNDR